VSHATLVNDGLLWLTITSSLLPVMFVHAVIRDSESEGRHHT
jgi:hypothetical protein